MTAILSKVAEAEGCVVSDAGEDLIAGVEDGVAVDRALSDMGVGDGDVQAFDARRRRSSPTFIHCSSGVSWRGKSWSSSPMKVR
jgi:hypothetical protein